MSRATQRSLLVARAGFPCRRWFASPAAIAAAFASAWTIGGSIVQWTDVASRGEHAGRSRGRVCWGTALCCWTGPFGTKRVGKGTHHRQKLEPVDITTVNNLPKREQDQAGARS